MSHEPVANIDNFCVSIVRYRDWRLWMFSMVFFLYMRQMSNWVVSCTDLAIYKQIEHLISILVVSMRVEFENFC